MANRSISRTASVLCVGAAALVVWAPIAGADDPPQCAPADQQCQQQKNPGAGIANQVIDDVQQGLDQAKQAPPSQGPNNGTPPIGTGTGLLLLVNGVPTCVPFGTAPPANALVQAPPGHANAGFC